MNGDDAASRCFKPVVTWDSQVKEYMEAAFGKEQFSAMQAALCTPPPSTCLRVNTLRASLQQVLEHVKANMQQAAASTPATEAAPGQQEATVLPYIHPDAPAIIMPGQGPVDVDYAQAGGKEVVISRKAGEAVLRGAPIYVPGVLACSPGLEAGDLVAVSVALEKPGSQSTGITRGTVIGSEAWQRAGPPDRTGLYVGLGRCEIGRTEMFRVESGVAVVMTQPVFKVPSCRGLEGKVMLQNLPSVVAALALAPTPGTKVLDMCAAPGGKTTMIAQLMGDRGEVIGLDRSHAKAAEITSLASELGMTCIKAYKMDATKAVLKAQQQQQQQQEQQGQQGQQQSIQEQGSRCPAVADQRQEDHPGHGHQRQQPGQQQQQQGGHQRRRDEQGDDEATKAGDAVSETGRSGLASPSGNGSVAGDSNAEARGREKVLKRQQRKEAAMAARGLQPKQVPGGDAPGASLPGFAPKSFDYILVDAPCSALGLRPRLLQTATLNYLHQCAAYQRRILDAAVTLLRPGGNLVFSTCTFNPGENEANVRYVLDTYPCMSLVQHAPRIGGAGLVGEHPGPAHLLHGHVNTATDATADDTECRQGKYEDAKAGEGPQSSVGSKVAREVWLTGPEAALVQRFSPTGETIAFFVAKFVKQASS